MIMIDNIKLHNFTSIQHSCRTNIDVVKWKKPFSTSILVKFSGHKMENPNIIVMTKLIPESPLPYLTLPYLTIPNLTIHSLNYPYLTLPNLTLPYIPLSYLTLPYHTLPYPYLTLPYLTHAQVSMHPHPHPSPILATTIQLSYLSLTCHLTSRYRRLSSFWTHQIRSGKESIEIYLYITSPLPLHTPYHPLLPIIPTQPSYCVSTLLSFCYQWVVLLLFFCICCCYH